MICQNFILLNNEITYEELPFDIPETKKIFFLYFVKTLCFPSQ